MRFGAWCLGFRAKAVGNWASVGYDLFVFQKARDMYRLQREAKRVKKQLRTIHIEAEHKGVTVTIDAEQTVLSIVIAPEVPREFIADFVKEALNRALKKAQVIAAEKMQGVMGELGLGGGGGG